jgi:hypothetical protein
VVDTAAVLLMGIVAWAVVLLTLVDPLCRTYCRRVPDPFTLADGAVNAVHVVVGWVGGTVAVVVGVGVGVVGVGVGVVGVDVGVAVAVGVGTLEQTPLCTEVAVAMLCA